ncbi:hypothetical protein MATL_G00104550 [Megalops atlanticus]|uniref:Uncharacterized protein n=1 Tax=Megalops atlanticus TaxID=7932 RepID=A0A9D3TDH8_MEGAT|nr:hypothetical protein MATL_G00104550 [Megalops atlanticus]
MAFKHHVSGTGTLTVEKQKWLLDSVKSGKLTFGQAVDAMNESSKNMDKLPTNIPQLSNEMQLSIMNKVKSGELTIEDALNQARRKTAELQRTEEENSSQCNFSVYKYNRYRWQKRILQIDFNTNMVCSIEKGIIKRQLPFSSVKSCDDGVGAKFSVSFRGRHDYELEAASLEDKQKIMQLIHKIIYGNIYEVPEPASSEACKQTPVNHSIRQGQLYLQKGGLASFRWVKFTVQLHEGELTLQPCGRRGAEDSDESASSLSPVVIHFSDGNASVEKPRSCDTFTLLTNKHEYLFRVPVTDQAKSTEAIRQERDEWVQAIDRLCLEWKRKSQSEGQNVYECIREPGAWGGSGEARGERGSMVLPTGDARPEESSDEDKSEAKPLSPPAPLTPKPTTPVPVLVPVVPSPVPVPVPQFAMIPPPPPLAPAPPPLPSKINANPRSMRTKAFHWDVVSQDKMGKSVWARCNPEKVKLDTQRLYEQFGVQDVGILGGFESNSNSNIMLNEKVAHNFSIFLKSFPVKPGELKDKLCIVNEVDGGLTDEHIASLRRYVPTADDIEMYKSYKGPVSELHVVDQYMLEMCNIPYLSARLDLLLTLRELPISMEDLQPLINQKIRMCSQLCGCQSFLSVLEYLLAVGNYLNENAGKEKAKGFRLSSLTKLSQLRGKDRKFTLLHALVDQIMLHDPHLATFFQELTEFETVPGASIKGLIAEVDVLKNELQKVIQYKKTHKKKNQGAQHPKFLKDLKAAIERYDADLSQLTKKCEEMKKLYADVLMKFGEPPEQDSQELFGWVCSFISDFRKIHSEVML